MVTRIIISPMNPGAKFGFSVIVEAIPAVNTRAIKKFKKCQNPKNNIVIIVRG